MKNFNVFKIEYNWYEGEHGENLLAKNVELKEFEKDLLEAKKFAETFIGKKVIDYNYQGKCYTVECLPQFYEQIIWFLIEERKYMLCDIDENLSFIVDDDINKKISITKSEKIIKNEKLTK